MATRTLQLLAAIGLALVLSSLGSVPAAGSPSAGGWARREADPTPWTLRDVDMVSASEGWTVASPTTGDHGIVLHTTDGGVSWSQAGGLFRQLNTVSFADATHGVALGNELRYTRDGGLTWRAGSGTLGTIYDAEMLTPSVGYATGGNVVIRTDDGGKTWNPTALPVNGNLVAIDFVDTATGWVVGNEGTVFRTTNGGKDWTRQRHDAEMFYSGVSFVDANNGWVSGDAPPTILHTTDGGAHWQAQAIPQDGDAVRIRMVNLTDGWAVGTLRTILHTSNGGATWTLQQGGVYADPNNRYAYWGIDPVDASTAVAVGAGVQIATTTDGGATWRSRGNGSPSIPYRLVRTDAQHLWSANSNSEVLFSTDGGARWSRSIIQAQLGCDTCSNTSDLSFVNDAEGWATINGEFTTTSWVWHTTDGGATWESLFVTNTGPLTGVAAIDATTLVAVSAIDDLIFRSTNGGRSWTPVPHPAVPDWFGVVRFLPGTGVGWAVGAHGKILKSTDSGKTWRLQRGGGQQPNLLDVSFADRKHGWAVGGQTLRTTDGGKTWRVQQPGVGVQFAIAAPSAKVAWIGGANGIALTTNAGKRWSAEQPADVNWFAVAAVDASTAWAGGQEAIDDVPGTIFMHSGSGPASPGLSGHPRADGRAARPPPRGR
jgi:photosystem II stability/assembly factor-like uncharacterized protein